MVRITRTLEIRREGKQLRYQRRMGASSGKHQLQYASQSKSGLEARTDTVVWPCLFFQLMHLGKLVANRKATASDFSTARCRGVSQAALRLMPSSS